MSSITGEQMGGTVGFLKILSRLCTEIQPTHVYCIWESGGSLRRRSLFKEYKQNRAPEKLNRYYEDDIPESDQNRMYQTNVLLSCLKCVPVCQVYVPDCEADDVIAHLVRGPLKPHEKIIASSDKDFYQLLDEKTRAYSFHKKDFVTKDDVLEEFRVTSKHFAIAKALCGDRGDNVPGVRGIGFRTVAKIFPFLGTEEDVILEDVFNYCHAHRDESAYYRRVLECEAEVKRNWQLVYLDSSMISNTLVSKVDSAVGTFVPTRDKMGLVRHLVKEGISDFDLDNFMRSFENVIGVLDGQ